MLYVLVLARPRCFDLGMRLMVVVESGGEYVGQVVGD